MLLPRFTKQTNDSEKAIYLATRFAKTEKVLKGKHQIITTYQLFNM